jgi:hypothetical protein
MSATYIIISALQEVEAGFEVGKSWVFSYKFFTLSGF